MLTATTKHNHGPNFGKKVAGCPRCEELKNGAEPVRWYVKHESDFDRAQRLGIRWTACDKGGAHNHAGGVCTCHDW